eukprot:CAMPEP_0185551098 /NCGR_PEP_ID=MMETSP1381-20130426/24006_1 /TAXON_ID=298111 /ORGANISM="Pavlova sp., Strain CCMP459" /LENGTH=90 /DNA_ID=CAMNT_0028163933 /DNA_START=507 /DNA_END=779 /DNA_ORIENTATION=+
MSARSTVTLTTSFMEQPPASMMAFMFSNTVLVCTSMVAPENSPVLGSKGIWPDTKSSPLVFTACEYGPMAAGALGVLITSRATGAERNAR